MGCRPSHEAARHAGDRHGPNGIPRLEMAALASVEGAKPATPPPAMEEPGHATLQFRSVDKLVGVIDFGST